MTWIPLLMGVGSVAGLVVVALLDFLGAAYPERFPRLAYLREWGETGQKP